MEWNLHYPSWMIADGEPDRAVGESFEWFAIEFGCREPLVKTDIRQKAVAPGDDHGYKITGEITFLSEKACVIDFGLKAIRVAGSKAVTLDYRQGDYVTGEIGIGLPLCIEVVPEPILQTLKRKWHINRISADVTPHTSRPFDRVRRMIARDESRTRYVDTISTRQVSASDYILHCVEVS